MRQIPSTMIVSYVDNDLGLMVEGAVGAGGLSLPTTAATFAPGCKITDLSTSVSYVNTGTAAVPVWSRGGSTAAVDPQIIQLVTTPITAAAMIDATASIGLSSTDGLLIAPAAPAGFVNVLHRVIVSYTFGVAAYTGGGNTTVNIAGGAALTGLIATTTLWQNASSIIQMFVPLSTVAFPITTATALKLKTASAVTNPGTAAGTAKVYCWYSLVAI